MGMYTEASIVCRCEWVKESEWVGVCERESERGDREGERESEAPRHSGRSDRLVARGRDIRLSCAVCEACGETEGRESPGD